MSVLDHVSIAVPDFATARPFYDAIMSALGVEKVYDLNDAIGYGIRCHSGEDSHTYVAIYLSPDANFNSKRHWCFKAKTRKQVRAFFEAGINQGGRDDGAPGLRVDYHPHYYAAFLIDPAGNRVEAVCHRAE